MEIDMQSFTCRRSAKINNFSKAQHLGSKPPPLAAADPQENRATPSQEAVLSVKPQSMDDLP
jgi:hypothetical protein